MSTQGNTLLPTLGQVVLSLSCGTAWQWLVLATYAGLSLGDVAQDLSIDGLARMFLCLCGRATSNRLVVTSDLTLGFADFGDCVTMKYTVRGRRGLVGVAVGIVIGVPLV